jgi:hypothetical protein
MIIQNSEKIQTLNKCATAITATKLTRSRNNLLEKMERLLSIRTDDPVNHHGESKKHIFLYSRTEQRIKNRDFGASRGWFDGLNVTVTCTA